MHTTTLIHEEEEDST